MLCDPGRVAEVHFGGRIVAACPNTNPPLFSLFSSFLAILLGSPSALQLPLLDATLHVLAAQVFRERNVAFLLISFRKKKVTVPQASALVANLITNPNDPYQFVRIVLSFSWNWTDYFPSASVAILAQTISRKLDVTQ